MKKIILPSTWQVTCHTDYIAKGSTFIAIKGQNTDGLEYILQALQKGASKIVVDHSALTTDLQQLANSFGAQLVAVDNTRQALSILSAQAWGYPTKKLKIIGVTGTKGKTTSVYALRHVLAQAGKKVAMISGVENMIGDQKFPANLTTPHPDYLQMFLAQCVLAKIEYVVMEISAQALSLHRVDDLELSGAIFTNLELEHSEFYPSIEQYFVAKCQIFKLLKPHACVVLNDDNSWVQMIGANQDKFFNPDFKLTIARFGTKNKQSKISNYYHLNLINTDLVSGLNFELSDLNHMPIMTGVSHQVFGSYNAYNLAGVMLCTKLLGLNVNKIEQAITNFMPAPGRLEIYKLPNGARGVVDYAHTPSSFSSVLNLLRSQTNHLIIVFGAGGGRDPIKRPVMGQIATQLCDLVILTNDNPRQEDPEQIIKQIIGGQSQDKILVEQDRGLAIKLAYRNSTPTSIIVLLGKGPDEYQMVGDQKYFFSDRNQLLELI